MKTEVIKASRISDVNIDDISLSHIKQNKIVPILYQQKKPLIFQTPFLEIQDAVSTTKQLGTNQFITTFSGDTKRRINNFFQFIESIETHIENHVKKNGGGWFAQKEISMTSLIRENGGPLYIKWPFDINTSFIDEKKQPCDFESIKKKDRVKIIVELSALWIDKNQFGLAFDVQKVLVKPFQEKILSEYIFDEDESDSGLGDEEQSNKIISIFATEQKTQSTSKKPRPDANISQASLETDPKPVKSKHMKPDSSNTTQVKNAKPIHNSAFNPDAKSVSKSRSKTNTLTSNNFNESTVIELVKNIEPDHKVSTHNSHSHPHSKSKSKSKPGLYIPSPPAKISSDNFITSSTSSDEYDIIDSYSD